MMFGQESGPGFNHSENEFAYREGTLFKEGVQMLAELDVTTHDKISIMATALGLKKTGIFCSSGAVMPSNLEKTLSRLGLFFYEDEGHLDRYRTATGDIDAQFETLLFADTPEHLQELLEANALPRDTDGHRAMGNALEYPPTAVEAFLDRHNPKDTHLMPQASKNAYLSEEEHKFSFFRYSREHFEEEIQWTEQIIAGIKEYAPEIYAQVMAER